MTLTLEFAGFRLWGQTYQPIRPTSAGWLWSETLERYLGIHAGKLRYFKAQGELVQTPEEESAEAQQQVERLSAQ